MSDPFYLHTQPINLAQRAIVEAEVARLGDAFWNSKLWYVTYKVFGKPHEAGPYTYEDVHVQFLDIYGYEYVTDCDIVYRSAA